MSSGKENPKKRKIDSVASAEFRRYEQRKALIFFEAAAGEISRVYPKKHAIEIMESYLEELKQV